VFHGSVPAQMRAFIAETVTSWGNPPMWVGCSGNFTIERTLAPRGIECHSNDVTLYSSAIGWWASGEAMPFVLKDDCDQIEWLRPYMEGEPESVLATILLASDFFPSVGKEDNAYHARQVKAYRHQWERMHARTVAKLQGSGFRLASYTAKDVREWLRDDVPDDAAVACFPPFFAGDYEAMFRALEKRIAWFPPSYETLDEDGKAELIERLSNREQWMIGLHHRWEVLEPWLKGSVQTANRGVPIWLYACEGPRRVVIPSQATTPVMVGRVSPTEPLTGAERIGLSLLTEGQFGSLRSQYMNAGIKPGQPTVAMAVTLDGKIAGCLAWTLTHHDPRAAYMLSDFPVAPTRHPRMSALIVRCAQSVEVRQVLERTFSRRMERVMTSAFTNNPASMKYRSGGMKRHSQSDANDGLHRFMLNYKADAGRWTLAEAYGHWYAQHGQKITVG